MIPFRRSVLVASLGAIVHTLVDQHWLHQTETFFPANLQQVPAHISLSWMWTIEFCSVEPFKTIMILPNNQRRKITLPNQIHYRPKYVPGERLSNFRPPIQSIWPFQFQ